jgi:hypothetical protein
MPIAMLDGAECRHVIDLAVEVRAFFPNGDDDGYRLMLGWAS